MSVVAGGHVEDVCWCSAVVHPSTLVTYYQIYVARCSNRCRPGICCIKATMMTGKGNDMTERIERVRSVLAFNPCSHRHEMKPKEPASCTSSGQVIVHNNHIILRLFTT